MLLHAYLRNQIVYVPTVVQLQTGAYRDIEPVTVLAVANADGLRRAFLGVSARQNDVVPPPPKDKWPPPVLLKYAGVKTWGAFTRGAAVWSIEETGGIYQIIGYRMHPKGHWEENPEQKTIFPTGTKVQDVIDRMIAILQEAARN
jgi:hypothetical protein